MYFQLKIAIHLFSISFFLFFLFCCSCYYFFDAQFLCVTLGALELSLALNSNLPASAS